MFEHFDVSLIEEAIGLVGVVFDVLGVCVILIGIVWATYRYLSRKYHRQHQRPYFAYKFDIGLTLLLGLEILVAADIIKTIALEPSFQSLGVLAVLIVIRTFLSWALVFDTVRQVTGREPVTFDQFARDFASVFSGQ